MAQLRGSVNLCVHFTLAECIPVHKHLSQMPNAFASAQGVPQNRVPFDSTSRQIIAKKGCQVLPSALPSRAFTTRNIPRRALVAPSRHANVNTLSTRSYPCIAVFALVLIHLNICSPSPRKLAHMPPMFSSPLLL